MTANEPSAALGGAIRTAMELDAPLNGRLAAIAKAVASHLPEFVPLEQKLLARLRASGEGSAVPGPGDLMPPFLLPDDRGRLVRLQDLLDMGPAAISFHRGHWCPYCQTNMMALAKAQHEIDALGARIVAVAPDRWKYTAELRKLSGATFPVLTDVDNGYALSLNLAVWLGAEIKRFYRELGNDLPKFQGSQSWMVPIPATFVVRQDGIIAARHLDPDYRQRMKIEDLLAALKLAR